MHIKFLRHGTGNPQKAVTYLLASHDHNGFPRPEVKVLRGNPKLVAELAETLSFVHRYTSGVISWHVDDDPSPGEMQAVLDDFERVAFAGMEHDQYSYAAISHGGHVHVFAARVELRSGLSHNMAPPGWQKAFDPLRNYWNHTKGWARPDDPNRARLVQPGRLIQANLAAVRRVEADELLSAFDAEPELQGRVQRKAAIVEWIRGRILAGCINSRADVITSLSEVGILNRVGKDYFSVLLPADNRPIRLKGTMFDARLDVDAIRAAEKIWVNVVGLGRSPPNLAAAAAAKLELDGAIKRRAIYNQGRYRVPIPSPIGANVLRQAASPPIKTVPSTLEKNVDRTGNNLIAEALRAFEFSRNAIRSLTLACGVAVGKIGALDRASQSLERASRVFERARSALIKRRGDEKRRLGGVKKGSQR